MKIAIKHNPNIVGTYSLAIKVRSDNFCSSAIQCIMKYIKAKDIGVIIYKSALHEAEFFHSIVMANLNEFKKLSSIIIVNRHTETIGSIADKVYSSNLFGDD